MRVIDCKLSALLAVGFAAVVPMNAGLAASRNPNIIFILADDIGYGDLGCYGATKVRTPNCDRLAAEGLRFTDAHSPSAMCTPTRYALLTGEYALRNPATARGVLSGEAPLSIKPGRVTLPLVLKRAGYRTCLVGKWHLGLGDAPKTDYNRDLKPGPVELGFDQAFFFPATGDRVPCVYVEGHHVVGLDPGDPIRLDYSVKRGDPDSYLMGVPRIGRQIGGKAALWKDDEMADVLAKKAVEFIEQHKDKQFFLYLATHDIHVPRVPNARFRNTSQAGVRGDTIHSFDWTVGQVIAALDRLRLADSTLVIVTSDNGGVLDANGPDIEHGGTEESNNGHLFNGVLNGRKGQLYEGGHRVPFIVRWPGKIKAGEKSDALICHADILASLAALTGQKLEAAAGPDSFNVLPALLGGPGAKGRDHLVMHAGNGALSIRKGPWKLIPGAGAAGGRKGKRSGGLETQLFNLATDIRETDNVANKHPGMVNELAALLEQLRANGRSRP